MGNACGSVKRGWSRPEFMLKRRLTFVEGDAIISRVDGGHVLELVGYEGDIGGCRIISEAWRAAGIAQAARDGRPTTGRPIACACGLGMLICCFG